MRADLLARLAAQVELHGVRGAAVALGRRLRWLVLADDPHVWYAVDVAGVRDLPLRDGYVLRRGTEADVGVLRGVPPVSGYRARARLRAGDELCLVLAGGQDLAFACWLLHDRAPALGLPGGALPLPQGVVNLEDSVAVPAHRGGGLGSAGMAQALRTLSGSAVHTVVTRVAADNAASRRAVTRAGFAEVASVTLRRRGLRTSRTVTPAPGSEGSWLVRALEELAGTTWSWRS